MKVFPKFVLISMSLGLLSGNLNANALGDLATTMQPGTWAELVQTNINPVLGQGSHMGNRVGTTNAGAWDPARLLLHHTGGDHGEGATFHLIYDAGTNGWINNGTIPIAPSHGYDHVTVDPKSSIVYCRVYGGNEIFKYSPGGFWSAATSWPVWGYVQVAVGTCWWTGSLSGADPHGALIVYNSGNPGGEIQIWDPVADKWLAPVTGFGGASTYHSVAEYSEIHNVAVVGGGNDNPNKLWRLNADRTVTAMPDAPLSICVLHGANLTSDPVTGNFLAEGSGQLWELDPRGAGHWTQQTGSRTPPAGIGPQETPTFIATLSAPVSNFGVVAYVNCIQSDCKMYLYKHAASGTSAGHAPAIRTAARLSASPNPFSRSTRISFSAALPAKAVLEIYDLSGKRIERMSGLTGEISWTPPLSAGGVFIAKLNDGKSVFSQKLLFLK